VSRKHSADKPRNRNAYCSFCRKSYRDVGPLVEGPGDVYICGECIELCQSIIEQEKRRCDLSKNRLLEVDEIVQTLDRVASGLRDDKQRLAAAVRGHYEHLAGDRPGDRAAVDRIAILLLGPSPSSKVFICRILAHLFDVPFAHGDVLALSPALAPDAIRESLFFRLLDAADYDIEAAERGLIYVNGIDRPDAVLFLVEVLQSKDKKNLFQGLALDPSRILFLCGGNFPALEEVMARRGHHPQQCPTADDLLALGLRPELVHHLNPIIGLPALDEAMLLPVLAHVDLKSLF
jgi:ATP-dependent Clp protease ATP-binding subunit ClpX